MRHRKAPPDRPCRGCGITRPIQFRGYCAPCGASLKRHEEDAPYRHFAEFRQLIADLDARIRRRNGR